MSPILRPAVTVANQLSFTQKIGFIVLSFTIPLLFAFGALITSANQVITLEQNHEKGLGVIIELKKLGIQLAKHRGNMAQHLNQTTSSTVSEQLSILEKKISDQISHLEILLSPETSSINVDYSLELKNIRNQWSSLKRSGQDKNPTSNFQKHSDQIQQVFQLIAEISSISEITQQQNSQDFSLVNLFVFKIPAMQESLGQLRGKASGFAANDILTADESQTLKALLTLNQHVHQSLETSSKIIFHDADYEEALLQLKSNYVQVSDNFFNTIQQDVLAAGKNGQTISISEDAIFKQGTDTIAAIGQLNDVIENIMVTASKEQLSQAIVQRNILLLVLGSVLIVTFYFSVAIITAIDTGISSMVKVLNKLAAGDFNQRSLVTTKDALNDMSIHLNQMVESVSSLLNSVKGSTTDLMEASKGLESMSSGCYKEINTQNGQTELVATAAAEMAATVKNVAESCSETAKATKIANEAALKGKDIVGENIIAINQLSDGVRSAAQIIDHLKIDVDKISGVIEVIRGISEQTNLLALNAAIEAARAGDQGRGFAVVADEVRGLAKRTQDSTSEIQSMIENLQKGSDEAVRITELSQEQATLSVNRSDNAGSALLEIVDQAEKLMMLNDEIATATEEQYSVAEEISKNTQILNSSVHEVLAHIQKTNASSTQLKNCAANLDSQVKSFKT